MINVDWYQDEGNTKHTAKRGPLFDDQQIIAAGEKDDIVNLVILLGQPSTSWSPNLTDLCLW